MAWAALVAVSMMAPVIAALPGQLPPIPDLVSRKDEFKKTVQEQIHQALEQLRTSPDSAEANGRLGMRLHAHQHYEFAEPLYVRAHRLDPESLPWAYYLGVVRVPLGMESEAAKMLRLAVALKPDYLPARMALAESLRRLGKLRESREIFRNILSDHPQSASAYAGLGRVFWEEGEISEAIENYEKACERFPRFGAAHYALGQAYRSLGNAQKSQEHLLLFRRHSAKEPPPEDPLLDAIGAMDSRAGYFLKEGFVLREQGRFREAATAFEELLKIEPNHAVAHGNLVSLYIALEDPVQVERHYRATIAIEPGMYKTHYNFGTFLGWQGRPEEAIAVLRKAIEVNPFHATSHSNLGHLLAQQGRTAEAEKHFLLAIRYEPNFALPHTNLGRLLMGQGKYREAIEHLHKALASDEENTAGRIYLLALAHAGQGDSKKAKEYALQASEKAVGPGQESVAEAARELLTQIDQAAKPDGR